MKPNWRRWWVGRAHQSSVGRTAPANYRCCSQAVGHSPSCMCQGKRRPLWAQAVLTKWWNARQKFPIAAFANWFLIFIKISKFLIKCIVSHIAHEICDRVELVTHCFSQYCDSNVWYFCCMWRITSWHTCSWNFVQFCCLQRKLYTKN